MNYSYLLMKNHHIEAVTYLHRAKEQALKINRYDMAIVCDIRLPILNGNSNCIDKKLKSL